jgi:hypothetical protein
MWIVFPLNASDRSRRSVSRTVRHVSWSPSCVTPASSSAGNTRRSPASRTDRRDHDFIHTLLVRRFATSIELGTTGRTRIIHVHNKPLYAAIGEPDNRNRRRVTIDRTIHRLMILDAVLADRSVNWLGSERDKRRYFKERLGNDLRDNEHPRLVFGKAPGVIVRYLPDKLPIGYELDRRRHVFLDLARSPSPMDFRIFILRHLELLDALGFWTIRVLFPKSMGHARDAYSRAAHELLPMPLTLSQRDQSIVCNQSRNQSRSRSAESCLAKMPRRCRTKRFSPSRTTRNRWRAR